MSLTQPTTYKSIDVFIKPSLTLDRGNEWGDKPASVHSCMFVCR